MDTAFPRRTLGRQGLAVSAIGLGCMGMSDFYGPSEASTNLAVLQTNKINYQRQKNQLDTAVIPPELYSKLRSVPAGEPFAVQMGNRMVASAVVGREPHPIADAQAKPVAVEAMRKAQTGKGLQDLLKSLRSQAKIDYQPGYAPPAKK